MVWRIVLLCVDTMSVIVMLAVACMLRWRGVGHRYSAPDIRDKTVRILLIIGFSTIAVFVITTYLLNQI